MAIIVLSGSVMAESDPITTPIPASVFASNYSMDFTQSNRYNSSYNYEKLVLVQPISGYGSVLVIYYPRVQIDELMWPVIKATKTPVATYYSVLFNLTYPETYPRDNIITYYAEFDSHSNRENNILTSQLIEKLPYPDGYLRVNTSKSEYTVYSSLGNIQIYSTKDIYDSSTLDVFFSPPPRLTLSQTLTQNPTQTQNLLGGILSGIGMILPLILGLIISVLSFKKLWSFLKTNLENT